MIFLHVYKTDKKLFNEKHKRENESMTLYFDFEERRRTAEVSWPTNVGSIHVTLTDKELVKKFPPDLIFEINQRNKVSFTEEDPHHKRLIQLQKTIGRKLQELANQL